MKLRKTFIAVFWTILLSLAVSGQPDWQKQISPVPDDLVSISFADSVNGWAVSDSERSFIRLTVDLPGRFSMPLINFCQVRSFSRTSKPDGWQGGFVRQ